MPDRDAAQCLMVIDVQRAFVEGQGAVPAAAALMAAVEAQVSAARAADALVVHLQNDGPSGAVDEPGTSGWELAVAPLPTETVVRKSEDDAFEETDLHEIVQAFGVEALSLCGVMSEMCVAATARGAMARGYRVLLAHDSHATYDVPAFSADEPAVPAELAARAAEWSLGDGIVIVADGSSVRFGPPSA